MNSNNIILNQHTCRFTIPFDIRILEKMTPSEYFEKYCRVNYQRSMIYRRFFDKYKNAELELTIESLSDSLSDIYSGLVENRLIKQLIDLLDLSPHSKIKFSQFCGIAAFSERYFFNLQKRSNGSNALIQKDILEILDFSSIKWKLNGVNVSSNFLEIFKFI